MPELGQYAVYIISAYACCFLILLVLIVHSLHRYFSTKQKLASINKPDDEP